MAERDDHAPGTFCWTVLSTTDQQAAARFYGGLFGWRAAAEAGASRSAMRLRGRDVAAIAAQPERQRASGARPMWTSYVAVASADAAAALAVELGGAVHAPPFDVAGEGRLAVIADPQGALLVLWQAAGHRGAGLVNEPGALVWNELTSPEPEAAAGFYAGLLGWRAAPFAGMDGPYLTMSAGARDAAGIRPPGPAAPSPGWLVYFAAADLDAALGRVGSLGGRVLRAQTAIPVGRTALVEDAQGAIFGLYEGVLDP